MKVYLDSRAAHSQPFRKYHIYDFCYTSSNNILSTQKLHRFNSLYIVAHGSISDKQINNIHSSIQSILRRTQYIWWVDDDEGYCVVKANKVRDYFVSFRMIDKVNPIWRVYFIEKDYWSMIFFADDALIERKKNAFQWYTWIMKYFDGMV